MTFDHNEITPGCKDAVEHYCQNEDQRRLFGAGFISGQAEKVYLGACVAAMFRPQPEHRSWMMGVQ